MARSCHHRHCPQPGVAAERFWRGPCALLLVPPLFGAGILLIGRAHGTDQPPFGLTFCRQVIASAGLRPFGWRDLVERRRIVPAHRPVIFACGASGFAGDPVRNDIALHMMPAATAAMLNATLPHMVPLVAWIITQEPLLARTITGIVVSLIGIGWIFGRGTWSVLATFAIGPGEFLVLLAVAGCALDAVRLRNRPRIVLDMALLAAMTLVTSVVRLPFWIWVVAKRRRRPFEPYAIASLRLIGRFASLVANALWHRSAAGLGPAQTGASCHLMAIDSSMLAFGLLGEPVRIVHLVDISLILLGFAVAVLPGRATRPEPARGSIQRTMTLSRSTTGERRRFDDRTTVAWVGERGQRGRL